MKLTAILLAALALAATAGCNDAQIASSNLSRAADIDFRGSGRELLEDPSENESR